MGLSPIQRIERGIHYTIYAQKALTTEQEADVKSLLHDRMTQTVLRSDSEFLSLFAASEPMPMSTVAVLEEGKSALVAANQSLGLALAEDEIDYLVTSYQHLQRNPTDVELMMFRSGQFRTLSA